jgi:hypothetical protein
VADPAAEGRDGAVAVAYVYNGHQVAYSWHHSMIELIGYDLCHEGRIIRGGYVAMKCGTDGLVDARNKAVRLFLKENLADWLFWIDTDMGFAADTVERLLAAADPVERPVVGGLAFTQKEEESDGMGGWRRRPDGVRLDRPGRRADGLQRAVEVPAGSAGAGRGDRCGVPAGPPRRIRADRGRVWHLV